MKKGFFFLIDGLIAIVILTIGFLLISSQKPAEFDETPMALIAENGVAVLAQAKVDDLCDDTCECTNEQLDIYCKGGQITNQSMTLLDIIGELYSKDMVSEAGQLFNSLSEENRLFRNDIFGTAIYIEEEEIYTTDEDGTDIKNNLISIKKIVLGASENRATGETVFWGPYVMEVHVWER